MSEVNSRRTVVENFRALGAHCQRIEDILSVGIPDLNLCYKGSEPWVEFKFVKAEDIPKRATTPLRIGLKPEQALWLNQRYAAGGRVAVLTKLEGLALNGQPLRPAWVLHKYTGEVALSGQNVFNMLRDGLPVDQFLKTASVVVTGDFKPRAKDFLSLLTGRIISE